MSEPKPGPIVVTNKDGGSQCHIDERVSLFPTNVLLAVLRVLGIGARKYGPGNWEKIPIEDHLDHAVRHILLFLEQRKVGDLVNAICRLAFAASLASRTHSLRETADE